MRRKKGKGSVSPSREPKRRKTRQTCRCYRLEKNERLGQPSVSSSDKYERKKRQLTKHILSHGPDLESDASDGGESLRGLEILEVIRVGDLLRSPDSLVLGVVDERSRPLALVLGVGDQRPDEGGKGRREEVSSSSNERAKKWTEKDGKGALRPRSTPRGILTSRVGDGRGDPVT